MGKNELAQHLNKSDLGNACGLRISSNDFLVLVASAALDEAFPHVAVTRCFEGLQKRLFGVPKLEDANMAGTKEARFDG